MRRRRKRQQNNISTRLNDDCCVMRCIMTVLVCVEKFYESKNAFLPPKQPTKKKQLKSGYVTIIMPSGQ
jgi:hypothetical protein